MRLSPFCLHAEIEARHEWKREAQPTGADKSKTPRERKDGMGGGGCRHQPANHKSVSHLSLLQDEDIPQKYVSALTVATEMANALYCSERSTSPHAGLQLDDFSSDFKVTDL